MEGAAADSTDMWSNPELEVKAGSCCICRELYSTLSIACASPSYHIGIPMAAHSFQQLFNARLTPHPNCLTIHPVSVPHVW